MNTPVEQYAVKKPSSWFWGTDYRTIEKLRASVEEGAVGLDWLVCRVGGGSEERVTIGELMKLHHPPTDSKAAPSASITSAKIFSSPAVPERTSKWSGIFRLLGIIGILVSLFGVGAVILGERTSIKEDGFIIATAGLISCIHCFFLGFLVDIFTDIRWYLAKLTMKQ